MSNTFLIFAVFGALLCGIIAGAIAGNRGLSTGLYFILGMILGVIGIVLAAVAPSPHRQQPMSTPPEWYPDPWSPGMQRWFDGYQWTSHQRPAS